MIAIKRFLIVFFVFFVFVCDCVFVCVCPETGSVFVLYVQVVARKGLVCYIKILCGWVVC